MSVRLPPHARIPLVLCAWTLLVWTTRIGNIWGDDDLTSGEKWGRTGLAMSFTALAVAVLVAVLRKASWRGLAVKALAGWTIVVWATRSFGIVTGDHDAAFVVVHLVLAVVSITLAVLAVVAVRDSTRSHPGTSRAPRTV
jgi:hypothetical protein